MWGEDVAHSMDEDHPPGTIQSDFTVLAIMERLKEQDGAGVTELAEDLGLSKSTVHKHLKSLESNRFVRNDDGTYELTLRLLEYGGYVRDRNRIYRFGRPRAEELANETGEMVFLLVREGNTGSFLFRTSNRYGLQNVIPLGQQPYLHQNAAGRAMLAECDDEEIEAYIAETGLPEAMEKTITDPESLWDAIEGVREQGFAVGRGERFEGIRAITAPVVDELTGAVGAIGIVVPDDTVVAGKLESEYAEQIIHAAREISLQMKFEEPSISVP